MAELEQEKITRIDAHSDFPSVTLLFQDDVGGLEVEDPNNPGQFRVSELVGRLGLPAH